jgi:hypothetical protein
MADYVPQVGNNVDVNFATSYTPQTGNDVDGNFTEEGTNLFTQYAFFLVLG